MSKKCGNTGRVELADLEFAPFYDKGGSVRAHQVFGEELDNVMEELYEG